MKIKNNPATVSIDWRRMAGLIRNIDCREDYAVSVWTRWPTPDLELFDGEKRLINSPKATPGEKEQEGKKKLFLWKLQWCAAGWNSLQCRGDSRVTAEDVNTLLVFTLCLTRWTFDTCHVEQQRIKSRKGAALRSTASPASASLAALKHASCWIVNNAAVKLLISLDITTNVYKLSVGQLRPLSPAGQLSGWVFINYSTFRQHITLVLLLFFSLLFLTPLFPSQY